MKTYILTSEQCRKADSSAPSFGMPLEKLMENAAFALYRAVEEQPPFPIVILCGKGNNGGDGYALCRLLLEEGRSAVCVSLTRENESPLCKKMRLALPPETVISFSDDPETVRERIREAGTVVDCLFGTGFRGELPPQAIQLLALSEGRFRIACDLPSGVYADGQGYAPGTPSVDRTVTFAFYKRCFFVGSSAEKCGKVTLADIGMPEAAVSAAAPETEIITSGTVRALLRPRPAYSHKGTFGSVQLFCGSDLMTGAAALAAKAALRSGVGLVYLTLPPEARKVLQSSLYEPVYTEPDALCPVSSRVIGPGLGIRRTEARRYLEDAVPTVVDADALNDLAERGTEPLLFSEHKVLTPHPAEMARLTGKTVKEVEADRFGIASAFAKEKGCTLILKGHRTLIALPDGRILVNMTGNSGLAKGGSGDVLAGYCGGLLAQGYTCEEAAVMAVYFHGRSAELLCSDGMEEGEIQPSDLLNVIGKKEKLLETME